MTMPQISGKTKVILIVVLVAIAFASGRYSVRQAKITTQIQQTSNTQVQDKKNTHTKTTETDVKKPDGTEIDTKITDEVENDNSNTDQQTDTKMQQVLVPPKTGKLNISIIGANDFGKGLLEPTYGASITKEVLGPVTVGAFGLMNGTVGVSVGLDF